MTSSSIFAGVTQKEIAIREFSGKVPLFYPDVAMMSFMMSADLEAVRAALPGPAYRPIRLTGQRALVALFCMEYRACDIGPYNEVALTIPVTFGVARPRRPRMLWSLLHAGLFPCFVVQLPVTTEVARVGGIDFFNFPKVLADIQFSEGGPTRRCILRDTTDSAPTLEAWGPMAPPPLRATGRLIEGRNLTLQSFTEMAGETHEGRFLLRIQRGWSGAVGRRAGFYLGDNLAAKPFADLDLGKPFLYACAPQCQGILFAPNRCQGG